jgi:riboflavin biosynthesis pyrimidine reductase
MEGSFPQPSALQAISADRNPLAREDHVAEVASFYAVSIDPHGKLLWNERAITDVDEGYNGAHIIEVLTENVSDDFLEHLQEKGVSYLFGGENKLDIARIASKLKELFGIKKLLLEGGGIVNGSFLQAGLIDEISLVIVPEVGSPGETALFETGKYSLATNFPASFHLTSIKELENGGLWLVYKI